MPVPPPPCPFPTDNPVPIASLAAMPAGARALLGEMADVGRPFQASDALPPGPHPPFRRFVAARGLGCTLAVSYEQGGFAHEWHTSRLRLVDGAWRLGEP